MLAADALSLAEYARNDSSLLSNHTPDVPDRLRRERDDLLFCINAYKSLPGEAETITQLERDLVEVEKALKVYAEPK